MRKTHRIKPWIVLVVTVGLLYFSFAVLLLYFSKPDRGGIRQCEVLSGVHQLRSFVTHREPLWRWKPFEHPRFRFHMPLSNFNAFKMQTKELGFEEWIEGSGQFGSFNEFSWDSNKLYYTQKYTTGKSCLFYYRPNIERLDAIIFYH